MNWKINFKSQAVEDLNKLDKQVQIRILKFIKKIETNENPKYLGAPLHGTLSNLWKYRIGDYRLICSFNHELSEIVITKVSHRKNAYKEK